MSRPVHVASKSRDCEHTACTRHTAASAWGVTGPNSQRRKLNATWPEGVQAQKYLGYRAGGGAGRGQVCRTSADQTVLPRCGLAGGQERSEGGCALSGLGEGNFCRALGRTSRTTGLAAAAYKSLQSSPTLCDPIDGRQPTRLPRPWLGRVLPLLLPV